MTKKKQVQQDDISADDLALIASFLSLLADVIATMALIKARNENKNKGAEEQDGDLPEVFRLSQRHIKSKS